MFLNPTQIVMIILAIIGTIFLFLGFILKNKKVKLAGIVSWILVPIILIVVITLGLAEEESKQQSQNIPNNVDNSSKIKEISILDVTNQFKNNVQIYSGEILKIDGNEITFKNYNNKTFKIIYDDTIKLYDARTEDTIEFKTIEVNDFIETGSLNNEKYFLIAKKKSGEELRKDLLKNMCLSHIDRKGSTVISPVMKNLRIINNENATATIEFNDIYFDGNKETFNIEVLFNSKTQISSKSGLSNSISTLKSSENEMISVIILDKNTIYDAKPIVLEFHTSDD